MESHSVLKLKTPFLTAVCDIVLEDTYNGDTNLLVKGSIMRTIPYELKRFITFCSCDKFMCLADLDCKCMPQVRKRRWIVSYSACFLGNSQILCLSLVTKLCA